MINEFTAKFDALMKEFESKKKVLALEGRKILHEQLKSIFDADPDLAVINWRQYTPYFNDGDLCIFGLHGMEIAWFKDNVLPEERAALNLQSIDEDAEAFIVANDLWDSDQKFPTLEEHPTYGLPEKCRLSFNAALGIFGFLDNNLEVAQDLFGDHVEVFATRTGIEVEEYSHD